MIAPNPNSTKPKYLVFSHPKQHPKNRSYGKHPRFTFPAGPDNALNKAWAPMEDDLSGHCIKVPREFGTEARG